MGKRACAIAMLFALAAAGGLRSQAHQHQTVGAAVATGPGTTGNPESSVSAAMNRSGDGILVFRRRIAPPPAAQYEILAMPLLRGAPAGIAFPVATVSDNATGTAELLRVRACVDEFGTFAVAWDDTDPATGWIRVRWRRGVLGQSQLGPVIDASPPGDPEHHILPSIAIGVAAGGTPRFVQLAWQRGTGLGASTILSRPYTLQGIGASETEIAGSVITVPSEPTPPGGGQERPALAIDGHGSVIFAWRRFDTWGAAAPYWRLMVRKRTGFQWDPVYDPLSPNAVGGFDWTDYPISPATAPLQNSLPEAAPAIAVNASSAGAVAWRKSTLAPFGLRGFERGPANSLAPLPATLTWTPSVWAAGYESYDLAVTQGGTALLLWEGTSTPQGGTGWAYISHGNLQTGAILQESLFDSSPGETITSVSLAIADGGWTLAATTRGPWPTSYRAWARRGDLDILAKTGPPGQPALSLRAPGLHGLAYHIWPMSTPPPQNSLQLPDGRRGDLDPGDPLLQWHLGLAPSNPVLPFASGVLDSTGSAATPVNLPPGAGPFQIPFVALVVDSLLPFPRQIRLFTHPETFTLP